MPRIPDVTKAIEAAVVRALRSGLTGSVRALERKLGRLNEGVDRLARRVGRKRGRAASASRSGRPPSKGRQLQGRYIGLLRPLTKKDQARVKSIRKKKSVEAAIRESIKLRR